MKISKQVLQKSVTFIDEANKKIKTADHLIYITYPLVKENRLFIKIFELLHGALQDAVQGLFTYEKNFHRISFGHDFHANFGKIRHPLFYQNYSLTEQEIKLMDEIFMTMESHKKAPLEFVRRDSFVIFSDGIRTSTLNLEKLKDYVLTIRKIVEKIEGKIKFS